MVPTEAPPAPPQPAPTAERAAPKKAKKRPRRRRRLKTTFRHSAGGVVVRNAQVLLIVSKSGHWRLPKGRLEPGETSVQAAIRETREETGVTGEPRDSLPGIEYVYVERGRRRIHKRVDFYLMDWVRGEPVDFDRTEVRDAAWFSFDDGLRKLWFENERVVVRRARELVEHPPGPPLAQEPAGSATGGGDPEAEAP
jgi:8-oxo-dGTP pyrophosphatase MutT (NUDIX family)